MKICAFLLFQFLIINSFSQNLIINGGFETYTTCPDDLGQINYATGWDNQNNGSADYFNTCATKPIVAIPDNCFGSCVPHNGNAYAGICMVKQEYFEFIQTKLISPLSPGKIYCLEFFIKKPQKYPFSLNQLALLISKDQNKTTSNSFYSDTLIKENSLVFYQVPQRLNNEWIAVRIIYKPKGQEQFLAIGINKPKGANGLNLHRQGMDSYYYIDDVSLTEIKKGEKCNCEQADSTSSKYAAAVGKPFTLQNTNFQLNSATLLPDSYEELNKLATYLKTQEQLKMEIIGHTDNIGKEEDNLKLSELRAKGVGDYLIKQGIPQSRITCKGYGSSKPIVDNTTEQNRAKNRRVEIIFKW